MAEGRVDLTKPGTTVYYRDKLVSESHVYVEGVVTDAKTVDEAEVQWDQNWSQSWGWVLEISPVEPVEEQRKKYRHVSSCKSAEDYLEWLSKRTSLYSKRLAKALENDQPTTVS